MEEKINIVFLLLKAILNDPFPLAGVFELVKTEDNEIKLIKLKSLKALHTLLTIHIVIFYSTI